VVRQLDDFVMDGELGEVAGCRQKAMVEAPNKQTAIAKAAEQLNIPPSRQNKIAVTTQARRTEVRPASPPVVPEPADQLASWLDSMSPTRAGFLSERMPGGQSNPWPQRPWFSAFI
jgi:hypothetical protein